jgi:Flp pilus assembly protein protease CpaA
MDWIIFGFVVAWLGIISWFDIRKNEIPNSLWVILPLIGACMFQAWQGDWRLVLLAVLVAAISERERLSQLLHRAEIGKFFTWFPLLFVGLIFAVQSSPIAAFAILGFWVAWELRWWGGADAVAALTLILIYPKGTFILAFLGVHVIAALVLTICSLLKSKSIKLHQIPGLPLLFLAVLSYQIVQCFPL